MIEGQSRIRSAAILQDGVIYIGRRHNEIISEIVTSTGISPVTGEQGFVTENGEFVNRKRAARIAYESGQVKELKWPRLGLFSEELTPTGS